MARLKNWKITAQDNLCILTIDVPKKSQNLLSSAVMKELGQALEQIEALSANGSINGLILASAKPCGFIAGADVSEFQKIGRAEQVADMLRHAHQVMNRIGSFSFPTVAMINGHCLGGGLELALACDYRVVCDHPSIRLGLPEVKLGIHPGFGGTARLIEITGVPSGMDLMLTGRAVAPATARKIGLVDLCVPKRQLRRAAQFVIDKPAAPKRAGALNRIFNFGPARKLMARYLKKQVSARAKRAHYPAPYALIDLWQQHGGDREAMLYQEQRSIARLFATPTCKNLVQVFFLREALKKIGRAPGRPHNDGEFRHVHVIGAGVMGGDIAAWCAFRGLNVTLHDSSADALARATMRAHRLFTKKLKQARLIERTMDRFQPDLAGHGAKRADVIIEAIFENAEAKIGVFSELVKIAGPNAILATNTSSIPLETISAALPKPGRLVGLHFFNPVAKMQLIEIVQGEKTLARISTRAAAFANRIGRLPVPVKSSPGFLVNRVLMPYTLEAIELLKEGFKAPAIDQVATDFGMPMGPITLADSVGLDICYHVGENLTRHFGGDLPELLKQKVKAGDLGKKTGKGFYIWEKGRPKKPDTASGGSTADCQDRLIFRYLNECVACLHEGIVKSSQQLDAALIFGTGFAPFRGGPINYIHARGPADMLARLQVLYEKHGERFKPSAGWKALENK